MPIITTNNDLAITPVNISIQHASPYETLVSPSVELPTSEPSNYTYTVTLTSSYFSTITPNPTSLFTYVNICQTCPVVQNTSGTSRTIYVKVYINNNLIINTNTSVSTGYYLTINTFLYDIKPDDVLQVKLWASGATTYFVYYNACVFPTRIIPTLFNATACQVDFNSLTTYPNFSLGNPNASATSNLYIYSGSLNIANINTMASYPSLWCSPFTSYRIANGDYSYMNIIAGSSSTTYYPYYFRSYVPTNITYRFIGR